jgi:hypothetical protein
VRGKTRRPGAKAAWHIADIGDNDWRRQTITIYRTPELAPGDAYQSASIFGDIRCGRCRSAIVLPGGMLIVTSKFVPAAVYRFIPRRYRG